jgi:hypothetical protein
MSVRYTGAVGGVKGKQYENGWREESLLGLLPVSPEHLTSACKSQSFEMAKFSRRTRASDSAALCLPGFQP